jgi:hypothetical protein
MECSIVLLVFLVASGFTVWKGYRFCKEPRRRWKVIGFLLMFLGVSWPFILYGGLQLVNKLTYRKLDFSKIKTGMMGDEVRAAWGEPTEIVSSPDGKMKEWHYHDSALGLNGGVVTFDQEERVKSVYHLGH